MWHEQERGLRGRFVRDESLREQARLRALAFFIGESALAVRPDGEPLSGGELRTLLAMAQGRPVREIAQTALAFSIPHLRKGTYAPIRKKLGARSMPHAIRIGFEDGLIETSSINPAPLRALSDTHRDVLELISLGAARKDVCRILDIAPATATAHLIEIKSRYGVHTPEHATAVGIAIGDIPLQAAA